MPPLQELQTKPQAIPCTKSLLEGLPICLECLRKHEPFLGGYLYLLMDVCTLLYGALFSEHKLLGTVFLSVLSELAAQTSE